MKKLFKLLISVLMSLSLISCSSESKEISVIHTTNLPEYAIYSEEENSYCFADKDGNIIHFTVSEQDEGKYDVLGGAAGFDDDGSFLYSIVLRPKNGYSFVEGFTIDDERVRSGFVDVDNGNIAIPVDEESAKEGMEVYNYKDLQAGDVIICWNVTLINNEISEIHIVDLPEYAIKDKEDNSYYLADKDGNIIHFTVSEQDKDKYDVLDGIAGYIDDSDKFMYCLVLRPKEGYTFAQGFTFDNERCISVFYKDEAETISTPIDEDDVKMLIEEHGFDDVQAGDFVFEWDVTFLDK